ncbi:polysaccharide lyase-like protein [Spirosoma oryzae]|uniref:Polysaccharide lyase-like protein n=1 Tax=Spirosoma oryzae TaxID=1469603 RepID=A0A2T0TBJ0_9BACT|nr:polysaccharide lyase [Spirosoma oryzae]PRY43033.1 polysaccharide lyase-like protein [Spirosoma oryzae]
MQRNNRSAVTFISATSTFLKTGMIALFASLMLASCAKVDTIAPAATTTEEHSSAREDASLLNSDSFDNTKLANFWHKELWTPTAGVLSTEQQRVGSKSMRFSWKPAQYDGTNTTLHSELASQSLINGETERWYGYSTYLPSASMANDTEPVIISQWHGVPNDGVSHTVPPMAITLEAANKLTLVYRASSNPIVKVMQHPTSQKIIDLGTASYDKWVDYVVHVKWDATGKTGVLQVWQDGVLKVNEQNISIGYPELQQPYWKVGLYAWTGKSTHSERVAFCDEVRIGGATANYDSVKPGRGNNSARIQAN